jgi:hypothetical protein
VGEVNTGTKGRAEKNGDIYELDESWFKERRERGVGEFTGIAFDLSASTIIRVGTGKGRKKRAAPSPDKVDPNRGYTKATRY